MSVMTMMTNSKEDEAGGQGDGKKEDYRVVTRRRMSSNYHDKEDKQL